MFDSFISQFNSIVIDQKKPHLVKKNEPDFFSIFDPKIRDDKKKLKKKRTPPPKFSLHIIIFIIHHYF